MIDFTPFYVWPIAAVVVLLSLWMLYRMIATPLKKSPEWEWTKTRHIAREVDGKRIIECGRWMNIIYGANGLFCLVMLAIPVFGPDADFEGMRLRTFLFALGAVLLCFVLPAYMGGFGVRIEFDHSGIQTRSLGRPKRNIPWSAVERVWYSSATQWYTVQTQGFGRIRIYYLLDGIGSLLDKLESRGIPVTRRGTVK
ncbi:MAG: hypothetical protein FWD53_04745 [Phycisphaerales bacterium]|nr:hypothetical protein [Phycisphaerales bacterium]